MTPWGPTMKVLMRVLTDCGRQHQPDGKSIVSRVNLSVESWRDVIMEQEYFQNATNITKEAGVSPVAARFHGVELRLDRSLPPDQIIAYNARGEPIGKYHATER